MISEPLAYYSGNAVVKTVLRVFTNFSVEGREAILPYGPLIVVSNHIGFLDPAILAAAIDRRLYFLAKRSIFGTPVLGPWARAYGAFPIDRNRRDLQGLYWALDRLREDKALAFFPEGTRSPRGLKKPVSGVVHLHLRTQAPILPVAITGSEKLRNIGHLFFPPGPLTVRIGSPFTLPILEGRLRREQKEAMADMVMQRIADLLPTEYKGIYASAIHSGLDGQISGRRGS